MHRTTRLGAAIPENFPLIFFLAAYFLTTVLANLLYPTWMGPAIAKVANQNIDLNAFPLMGTTGFWALLLLPFVVAPLVLAAFRAVRPALPDFNPWTTEFSRLHYVAVAGACYLFCAYAFWRHGVWELAVTGTDAYEAVSARFEIIRRLGFWPLVVLKSVLVFLSIYGLIRALRERSRFWWAVTTANIMLMAPLLFGLGMKWPLLNYFLILGLTAMLFTRGSLLLKIAGLVAVLAAAYVVTTLTVMRLGDQASENNRGMALITECWPSVERQWPHHPCTLLAGAANRMAVSYPFYYQTFTERGPICGTLLDRVKRKPSPCNPSLLIYEQAFGRDGFEGRGTAPAAVNIYGYALGGWIPAGIELVLACVVLIGFSTLWKYTAASAMAGAVFMMGVYAAYFFSQLPFEGPIIYDHGILWPLLLVGAYLAGSRFFQPVRPTVLRHEQMSRATRSARGRLKVQ